MPQQLKLCDFCHAFKLKCNGPSWTESAKITTWPHITLFGVSTRDNRMDIGAIEEKFSWRNKKFILRGSILGDDKHFTTVLQMPHGWMHFDDVMHLKFLLFDKDESEAAMMGQGINCLAFEVVAALSQNNLAMKIMNGEKHLLEQ